MSIALVNDVELYYEDRGSGDCIVLTHGSWTDADGWRPAAVWLAENYRVVTWDRRGHSRSAAAHGPGSRSEDAADLAGLVEYLSDEPVHVVGNSYGANVTLTLVAERPDLVATAAVHEPPLFKLLEGTRDPRLLQELASVDEHLMIVRDLIIAERHRDAAEYFIEHVALGPGTWAQLPVELRATLERNAPTYLDEMADETALTLDTAALAASYVPIQLTYGTESPVLFPAVIAELRRSVDADVEILTGAGHIPHSTNTAQWVTELIAFHQRAASNSAARTQPVPGIP